MSAIDIDTLLEEISADAPSGDDLEYDPKFREVENNINGKIKPKIVDGKQLDETIPPEWPELRKSALDVLARSHDLRMAIHLTRVLVHTSGIKGLHDGLSLLLGLVEGFWDTLHPQLDSEDGNSPIRRVNALSEFSDRNKFVRPLRTLKLCKSSRMGQYGLVDMDVANGKIAVPDDEKEDAPTTSVIDAAFQDTEASILAENRDAVHANLGILNKLESSINEKIGGSGESVDFKEIRNVLDEMSGVLGRWVPDTPAEPEVEEESEGGDGEEDSGGEGTPQPPPSKPGGKPQKTGAIENRQDVVMMLDRICQYYAKHEPGSPVPLFLQRAKGLVNKNFLEIMNDMVPDSVGQIQALVGGTKEDDS